MSNHVGNKQRRPRQARFVFNLGVGMGDSYMRFERQEQALRAFVREHKEELDRMPYASHTVDPIPSRAALLRGPDLHVGQSEVAPGILGVFPTYHLPPIPNRTDVSRKSAAGRLMQTACRRGCGQM